MRRYSAMDVQSARKATDCSLLTKRRGESSRASLARNLSRQQLEQRLAAFAQSAYDPQPSAKIYQPSRWRPARARRPCMRNISSHKRLAEESAQGALEGRNRKNLLIEAAKNEARLKRAAICLLAGGRLDKKLLYQLTSTTLRNKIQVINGQYRAKRKALARLRRPT